MDWIKEHGIELLLVFGTIVGSYTAFSVWVTGLETRIASMETVVHEAKVDLKTLQARVSESELNNARETKALEGLVIATADLTKQVRYLSIEVAKLSVK